MRILLFTVLLAAAAPAAAETPDELRALQRYFDTVETLEGRFVQETLDAAGDVAERSSGRMMIKRPDRFRWIYEEPFPQQIVADGQWLWVYDQELSQVTVRPLDELLGVGPGVLLSGDYDSLVASFHIEPGRPQGWLALRPRESEWDFQDARLRLQDGVPVELMIDDGLGQITRFRLQDLESNVRLPDSRFRFQVPEGVDVVAPAGAPVAGPDD